MIGPYKTPASNVRTGQVIKVERDGYDLGLEVEIVHHLAYGTDTVVAFTGWTNHHEHIDCGWVQGRDTEVLVVEDRRGHSYLTLTGDSR